MRGLTTAVHGGREEEEREEEEEEGRQLPRCRQKCAL